jgi:hypothetical protein
VKADEHIDNLDASNNNIEPLTPSPLKVPCLTDPLAPCQTDILAEDLYASNLDKEAFIEYIIGIVRTELLQPLKPSHILGMWWNAVKLKSCTIIS